MIEIERKFLVESDAFKKQASSKEYIKQGFLNTHPERTVRIRIIENQAYLTVKGVSNASGLSRLEWEKEIKPEDAQILMNLCESHPIEKYRYQVSHGAHIFEVDEFLDRNKDLVIAEIELKSEDEKFQKPDWLGQEVTGETKYYNSQLSLKPYSLWE
jgi:CYTH domain-containing protein